jgi:hypothetical protein
MPTATGSPRLQPWEEVKAYCPSCRRRLSRRRLSVRVDRLALSVPFPAASLSGVEVHLHVVAVRVVEVRRPADAVVDRRHLDATLPQAVVCRRQRVGDRHLEGDVVAAEASVVSVVAVTVTVIVTAGDL